MALSTTRTHSSINTEADRRTFDHLRTVAGQYGDTMGDDVLTEYTRYCRRLKWSYALIADALNVSASKVRRLHHAWQAQYN